jgi:acetolactate synthase I/II/III large subunit
MRVADYAVDYLHRNGVTHVFTLAGGGAMFLNDALAAHPGIHYVCTHHEQAAAMAAEAYAKTSGHVGAVVVTSGPGSTNAITGLLGAWQDSIPVVFLSSQTKRSQMIQFSGIRSLRQFGVQEVNIVPIIESLTKYAAVVERPEDIRYQLERALALATNGRPGPVWLDIPSDVAGAAVEPAALQGFTPPASLKGRLRPTDQDVTLVLEALSQARRPLIIAGGGIRLAGAVTSFQELIGELRIPVVVPEMGLDLLSFDHEYYVGHGGTKGQRPANLAIQHADLLLSIGSRLAVPFIGHDYKSFAPYARKIVVDIDREEHEKPTIAIDHFIHADARLFIEGLLQAHGGHAVTSNGAWAAKCRQLKIRYPACTPDLVRPGGPVNMYYAVDRISHHASEKDIFTVDAGATAYAVCQALRLKAGQRLIIPGCTLTMGYNLPAVVGISAASPNSRVICITGDGSFQMNIHELQTIRHNGIPAKLFVTSNGGYLAIRTTQKQYFDGRFIGEGPKSGVSFPDLEDIAKAFGLKFWRIQEGSQLDQIVKEVLEEPGPALCEIICPEWQEIMTVSSRKLDDGRMESQAFDNLSPFLGDKELEQVRSELLS